MGTVTEQEQRVGTRLRELREARRLSVRTLAGRAGFSPSFISQVENEQASPSIASLERIANAMEVNLAEFFVPRAATVRVIRASQRADYTSTWSNAEIAVLGMVGPHSALEPVMLTLGPRGRSGAHPATHPGEKFAFVVDGAARLTLDGAIYDLGPGDAITFRTDTAHLWENGGEDPARIILVSTHYANCAPAPPEVGQTS